MERILFSTTTQQEPVHVPIRIDTECVVASHQNESVMQKTRKFFFHRVLSTGEMVPLDVASLSPQIVITISNTYQLCQNREDCCLSTEGLKAFISEIISQRSNQPESMPEEEESVCPSHLQENKITPMVPIPHGPNNMCGVISHVPQPKTIEKCDEPDYPETAWMKLKRRKAATWFPGM